MSKVTLNLSAVVNKTIVTITGPSASGKSTLEHILCDAIPETVFRKVVSHTTRRPRKGEVDGEHYHFVTQGQFDYMAGENQFAEIVKFGIHSYGAHVEEFASIFAAKKIAVVVCEPVGREAIQGYAATHGIKSLSVFVTNPPAVRYQRLLDRFIQDIEHLELGGALMQAQKAKFAERLAVIETVESKWHGRGWEYDLKFDHFDDTNTNQVASKVVELALGRAVSVVTR